MIWTLTSSLINQMLPFCPQMDLLRMRHTLLALLLLVVMTVSRGDRDMTTLEMLMPHVRPTQKDTYFCTSFRMHENDHQYIVEFKPNATKNTAHHILIYGCESPGYVERDTPRAIWDCGEMAEATSTEYSRGPTCKSGSQIIYAWAMDAPKLVLPEGVGFKVGGDTGVNYLVLQVHYASIDRFKDNSTDDSGIILSLLPHDTEKVNKRAGVLLLGTGGSIPAHSVVHMETTCEIDEPLELHPFAFRTHTHKLGTVVSGWRIEYNSEGLPNWSLVGRHDPQQPQMFYPVDSDREMVVKKGDVMAARCTMNNTRDHRVNIGSTGNDEMCNFYMMYYVDGDQVMEKKYCFSMGPPMFYWKTDRLIGGYIPPQVDREASRL